MRAALQECAPHLQLPQPPGSERRKHLAPSFVLSVSFLHFHSASFEAVCSIGWRVAFASYPLFVIV
jgi:hypothetical protein